MKPPVHQNAERIAGTVPVGKTVREKPNSYAGLVVHKTLKDLFRMVSEIQTCCYVFLTFGSTSGEAAP